MEPLSPNQNASETFGRHVATIQYSSQTIQLYLSIMILFINSQEAEDAGYFQYFKDKTENEKSG